MKEEGVTDNLPQQDNVLPSDQKDSSGNISISIPNIYPFNGILQHKVGWIGWEEDEEGLGEKEEGRK